MMDEALPNDQREALVEQIQQEKSAKCRLLLAAKISRQMYDAESAEMEIFKGASVLSPEFKELEKERELRRYQRQEETAKQMAPFFRKNLSPTQAQDISWAFTGRDLYRLLVIERGWSSDAYEAWLGQLLITTLLDPEAEREIHS